MSEAGDYPLAARRVAVIGLDCAPPGLVFDQMGDDLPNLAALCRAGVYGEMESCVPPITLPAWAVMFTGRDPGELGIYGFRNRADHSYAGLALADSRAVAAPKLWQVLGRAGKRSILLGVPPTYPPEPMNGLMVGCFLTPDKRAAYTHPRWLKARLDAWAGGEYVIDVKEFRTPDKERLLGELRRMATARFTLARRLVREPWDLFWMVEIGTDRLHHGFWRFHDPTHRLYEPGNPYRHAIRDYYRLVDAELGRLVAALPPETLVLVVSDHGAQAMRGGVAINQWLLENGWLALKDPEAQGPLTPDMVDWPKTRAWGEGGYYARIYLNVAGREPQGVIAPEDYEATRAGLAAALEAMPDHEGRPLGNQAHTPQELYQEVRGVPPDLILLPGGLAWRALAGVNDGGIYRFANDTGPDDANHAMAGMMVAAVTGRELPAPPGGRRLAAPGASIYQVFPTVLRALGQEPPQGLRGASLDPWG